MPRAQSSAIFVDTFNESTSSFLNNVSKLPPAMYSETMEVNPSAETVVPRNCTM
jgi:hypothetical protein